ncbi:integrase [Vibrio sp. 10N.222.54.A1]|uniref:hypothetical protein n=2 Tax=Vibrio TaxID=662 RepID=UPI000977B4F3|nr:MULTISPECIES: hypothetical protein [unclassified Vibrio]CAK3354972.1 Integrase [Vibrio crassostreae]OMO37553.1 hypothetical protein BH584_01740 [Vibrio sp. 10N.261.45.E1]PMJ22855.1 hypothetical protein BCU27_16080 [Vibrio sp. 10N.286.45.B6]PML86225.1 hypothetical protein BCT66_14680 [Vibrio sp. 10N.261.49.E11]PMM78522.1 hypothetical protein BCT48_22925 [Vibrio sp. 10N.261.46.F12]
MKAVKREKKIQKQSNQFFNFHYLGLGHKKTKQSTLIHGVRTMNENIRIITKVLRDTGLDRIKQISFDVAQQYLQDSRNLGYSHKHLSNIKSSLQRVIDKYSQGKRLTIPKIDPEFISSVRAKQQGNLANKNRAYLDSDLNKIIQNMSPHHAFSTLLAYSAGLRAEELFTIRRNDEGSASKHRAWRTDRFHNRGEGVCYLVTGKNGLVREVFIHQDLADKLETLRFDTPQFSSDRKIRYEQRYNLCAGNRFSKAFSHASYKTLGWSLGAHGLRFSYAQRRMDHELLDVSYDDALHIVSQELGHFRPEITLRYIYPFGK